MGNVVAIVSDAVYPYHKGGKEVRYHQLVSGLAERGFDVHVFTMHWWKGPRDRLDDGVHYHAVCRRYELYSGSRRSIVQALMFALGCVRLLRYRVDLIDADEMPHLHLFTVRAVSRLRRIPLVVTWHEHWGARYWREYLGLLGSVAAVVEVLTLRLADHLIAPSPETARRLCDQGVAKERVTVVPNGVDLEALRSSRPSSQSYDVLYVGRLLEHKHVDLLLDALVQLRARGRELSCAIVGTGPERGRLEEQIEREGLRSAVDMLGGQADQREIFGLMRSAGVFVLPSTREGYGIVVAEALACGLPVVTTNHPDNHARELLKEGVNGWLADLSATSLADSIASALDSRAAAGKPAPGEADTLGWDACVDRTIEVYDLLSRARAA